MGTLKSTITQHIKYLIMSDLEKAMTEFMRLLLEKAQDAVIATIEEFPERAAGKLDVFSDEHLGRLIEKATESERFEVAAILKKELDGRNKQEAV